MNTVSCIFSCSMRSGLAGIICSSSIVSPLSLCIYIHILAVRLETDQRVKHTLLMKHITIVTRLSITKGTLDPAPWSLQTLEHYCLWVRPSPTCHVIISNPDEGFKYQRKCTTNRKILDIFLYVFCIFFICIFKLQHVF